MAVPRRHFVRNFYESVARDLSLWQISLLLLWLLALLLQRVSGAALSLLEEWLFDSLVDDVAESSVSPDGDDDCVDTPLDDDQVGVPTAESCTLTDSSSSLIPSLPNIIVQEHVWPHLVNPPLVPFLLQLRSVNLSWRHFMDTTVEWSTLKFLQLDRPGSYKSTVLSREAVISMTERYQDELANFRVLVAESMEDIEYRVRYARLGERRLPFYVTVEGCPPDVMDNPEYYGL